MQNREKSNYRSARSWRLLLCGIATNAIGVSLVAHASFGISAISSFPYSLSVAFPVFTFGVWTYLFQIAMILALIAIFRRMDIQYCLAFVVSILFGYLLDGFGLLVNLIPSHILLRFLCYTAGTLIMATGTCMAVESGLPVLPQDLFLRELSTQKGWKFQNIKTVFDCSCVSGSVAVGLLIHGRVAGIGVGTLVSALVMGKCVSLARKALGYK